uniref:Uncharacterized protein n=2 Tax=Parascaris univalens TaxID=6257 RepID=A0A915C0S4_PARUN
AAGQMFVNMNMNITTCGAHSGLIVHSGVHHGKADATLIWPYPINIQPTASVPFLNAPLPLQQQRQQHRQSQQQSLSWPKESTCSTNRTSSFRGITNSPSSEFIEPDNVQLNVFSVDPVNHSGPEPRKLDSGNKFAVERRPGALLDDTVTTTTTVEVFRTKVDPNNPNGYITLPPVPAQGMDGRPQVLRALGPDYEKWTTSRTETVINEPIKWPDHSELRTATEASPHNENYASSGFVDRHTYKGTASSPPAAHKTARDGTSANKRKHVRMSQGSPFHAKHSQVETTGRQEEESLYEMARSRSVEDIRNQYVPDYLPQRPRPRMGVPIYEVPSRSSYPRSEGVQMSTTPKTAKSEEIFHLYETRDACGNIRAKCETATSLRDGQIPMSTSSAFLDDSTTSQIAVTSNSTRSDMLSKRASTASPYLDESRGYTPLTDDTLIPYYSTQDATRSTIGSYTYPQHLERYPRNFSASHSPQESQYNFTSVYELRNLDVMREISETNPPLQPKSNQARLQSPIESENFDIMQDFDEIHVGAKNMTFPLRSEKYGSLPDSAYPRCSMLVPRADSVRLHHKLNSGLRSANRPSEGISLRPGVPLEALPEISVLESQKEDTSMRMKISGNGDPSCRKVIDVSRDLNEFSQTETKYAERISPTYEEFPKLEREPDSLHLVYDISGAHESSLLEDAAYRRSMADVLDLTSTLQVNEVEQSSRHVNRLSTFRSPPYVFPRPPKLDPETIEISSQAILNESVHTEDVNSVSDSIHERDCDPGADTVAVRSDIIFAPSVGSTINSDEESRHDSVFSELKQQHEELTPKSTAINSSVPHVSELEHSMSSAEKESVIINDGEVVRENIQTASAEEFLNANDNQMSDISFTDIP